MLWYVCEWARASSQITIRTRLSNVTTLVSVILTASFSSSFLFIYIKNVYFIEPVKNAPLILLIAVHFVVTHEEEVEKKWQLLSVWKHSWNVVSSSHSDQVIKIIVKFISASATTIIIYFILLNWENLVKRKMKMRSHLSSQEESCNVNRELVAVAVAIANKTMYAFTPTKMLISIQHFMLYFILLYIRRLESLRRNL